MNKKYVCQPAPDGPNQDHYSTFFITAQSAKLATCSWDIAKPVNLEASNTSLEKVACEHHFTNEA